MHASMYRKLPRAKRLRNIVHAAARPSALWQQRACAHSHLRTRAERTTQTKEGNTVHHIVIADNTAKMNASLFDRFRVQGSGIFTACGACIFLCACGTRASVDAHTHTHTHTHTHIVTEN